MVFSDCFRYTTSVTLLLRRFDVFLARHELLLRVIVVCLFVCVAAGFVFLKLAALGYNALDLGIFHQVVANTAAGRLFALSIHPPSYFGDHVSPLLVVLVPFYWLFPHVTTLLVAQIIAIALGVFPLLMLARTLRPAHRFILLLSYFCLPLIQNFSAFEFELLVFAVPLLLAALVAYERRRFGWFCLWLLLAAMVREDVGLILVGLGLLALIERRSWRWSVIPACAGLLVFFGGMALAGHVNGERYKFLVYYSWLGATTHQAVVFLFDPSVDGAG